MDVIASKLLNLEHSTIRSPSQKGLDDENSFWLRMRRLYVLHRLPCLETLNGMPITNEERCFLNPSIASRGENKTAIMKKENVSTISVDISRRRNHSYYYYRHPIYRSVPRHFTAVSYTQNLDDNVSKYVVVRDATWLPESAVSSCNEHANTWKHAIDLLNHRLHTTLRFVGMRC